MATYFVKTTGSDANNGTTWALAKATIQAGLTLCTTAGDRCAVAPGRYNESNLVPHSEGSAGAGVKEFVGDTDGTIADGGGLYHGAASGAVLIDGTVLATGVPTTDRIVADNAKWAYWNIRRLYLGGSSGTGAAAVRANMHYYDCAAHSFGTAGFYFLSVGSAGATVSTLTRCVGSVGGAITASSLNSVPDVILYNCSLIGGTNALFVAVGDATHYSWIKLENCSLLTTRGGTSDIGIGCAAALQPYVTAQLVRTVVQSYVDATSGMTLILDADSRFAGVTANLMGALRTTRAPFRAPVLRLNPSSDCIGAVVAGYTRAGGMDLFGYPSASDSNDVGCQEYDGGSLPRHPVSTGGLMAVPRTWSSDLGRFRF